MNARTNLLDYAGYLGRKYCPWGGPPPAITQVKIDLIKSAIPLINENATTSQKNAKQLQKLLDTLCVKQLSKTKLLFYRDIIVSYCNAH